MLDDFESGKFKSVKDTKKELSRHAQVARFTLKKSRNINIRLSEKDLQSIKAIAAQRGLPYQTLITSILHQYTTKGEIKV